MKILILVLAIACLAVSSWAQAPAGSASTGNGKSKPIPPSGPLLKPAADFSQWEVDYVYPDDQKKNRDGAAAPKADASADERPRKAVTTKTGSLVHEQMTDIIQRVTDVWFSGGSQYTKSSGDSVWYGAVGGVRGTSNYNPLPANGYRDLDWIKADSYVGTIPYNGGNYLVFTPGGYQQLDLSSPEARDKNLSAATVVAYIDADTRMPVSLRNASVLRVYHFAPPPTQMQTLPADLADQIKKGNEVRARLFEPANRPY